MPAQSHLSSAQPDSLGTSAPGRAGERSSDAFTPSEVELTPVSPLLVPIRLIGMALTWGAVGVIIGVLAAVWVPWLWWGLVPVALGALWTAWLIPRQVRAKGYALGEDHLYWRTGVMFQTLSVIPYGRMQYVDTNQGPIARHFGIAEVELHTASASTDATIDGLPVEEAKRLRTLLSQRGEERMAGL